jgi:outer membrane protein OmpA-like peptidoglycan-associated protein
MAENRGSGKVTNLGLPFNSNRDDFCFIIGKRLGYLSSNRDGGQGNDDIYAFDIYNADPSVKTAILNKEEIANRVPKPVETPVEKPVVVDSGSIDIGGRVTTDSGAPKENVTINIQDKNGTNTGTTQTDKNGVFKIKNAPHGTKPVIAQVVKPLKPTKPSTTNQNIKLADVSIIKSNKKVARFLFENIYFDFDGDSLRPEAKKTMDELIAYSNENTHIQLELNANTDNLGDASYNKELSARRAEAAKNYLLSHGLHKNSLIVRALGEAKPIAGNTNPAGRTLNRRVEFFIRGGQAYTAGAMAYVPETDDKFSNIANQFGMTTEEILTLNATTDENVKAYTPVRVKRKLAGRFVAPVTMALTKTPRPDLLPELEGRPAVKKHPKKGKQ